jgi:hypothetical protein
MVFEQIPFPRKKFSPINQVFIANLFIRVLLNEETCDRYWTYLSNFFMLVTKTIIF